MSAPRVAMTTLRTAMQCNARALPGTSGARVLELAAEQ